LTDLENVIDLSRAQESPGLCSQEKPMNWGEPTESDSVVSERVTWECDDYRVMASRVPLGYRKYRKGTHLGYEDVVYAMFFDGSWWSIISKHTGRRAAEAACEKHSKMKKREVAKGIKEVKRRKGKVRRGHEKLFHG
jgi:hypothetical protein